MLPTLDLRPLQEGHAVRGIGRYVATLADELPFSRVVVWGGLPIPELATGREVVSVPGCPRSGRLGWAADLLRASNGRGLDAHVPVADVRLSRPAARVVTVHDAIPWRFPTMYPAGRIGAVRLRGDAAFARRARIALVPSQASAEDAVRFLGVREAAVHVVSHTAGPGWPRPQPGSGRHAPEARMMGRRYVVAAGGFQQADPRKRLADVVDALCHLDDDVALVVTGAHGPFADSFLAHAERVGLGGRVTLTGQLPQAELVNVFAGAAAFAFPSAWEGFGLPLLEAMSLGLPCVVADGGALPEVAGNAASVVPVGDVSALGEALRELMGDASRAERASRRATERVAVFTAEHFAEGHRQAYESA